MIQISRWLVHAASVLAVLVLCSCVDTYTPDQSLVQKMSVKEARNIVSELVKPPVEVFDKSQNSKKEISKVNVRTTEITVSVIENQKYNVLLQDLEPSWEFDHGPYTDFVYLNKNLAFYADLNMVHGTQSPAFLDAAADQRLVDALFVLKSAAIKFTVDDEARFQEAARNYQASEVKPQLPEDARRFAVQAEGAIRDKDFAAAANYYEQALEVAPWWPQGHYDRAMVLATGVDDYPDAIIEMKRYLTLVPDAPNARALQDKIYDWERKASSADN